VLADGTGAFTFLKAIVTNYLCLKHDLSVEPDSTEMASNEAKNEDAFRQFYSKEKSREQLGKMLKTNAYQIEMDRDANLDNRLVEGVVSAKQFIELAHKYNTTAGILTVALFIKATYNVMSLGEREKTMIISVPVNLRQYFPSETTRNFFGVINVPFYAKNYDGNFESLLEVVKKSFEEQLTEEKLRETMNGYSGLTSNFMLKLIPLFIKDPVINMLSRLAKKGTTATISNLGVIKMQKELVPYIKQFSAFMSTANIQICVSSFGDRMVFGAVSAYSEHAVFTNFFRGLTKRGLSVEIASNDFDNKEETVEKAEEE
jgi:NRPS condensation-like uncharacterized protein